MPKIIILEKDGQAKAFDSEDFFENFAYIYEDLLYRFDTETLGTLTDQMRNEPRLALVNVAFNMAFEFTEKYESTAWGEELLWDDTISKFIENKLNN